MEIEANIFILMLFFLGLGSSFIHYRKAAKIKAQLVVKSKLREFKEK